MGSTRVVLPTRRHPSHVSEQTPNMQSAPPTTSTVEEAFRPAFDEIQRRVSAGSNTYTSETTFFSRGDQPCHLPFHLPDQDFVLLTMGTPVLAPKPLHADRPCARVYGAFPTREDAAEHASIVAERDPTCSLVVVKRDQWVLFPLTERVRDDPEEAEARMHRRLQERKEWLDKERIEFERDVSERRERDRNVASSSSSSLPPPSDDPAEEKEDEEAEKIVYAPPKRLRAGAEVRGQASAVVAVLPDEFGEVMLRVLGCFESTLDADRWCREVGSRHVTDFDLLVVPTCDWFYPNGAGTCTSNEQYRIGELQKIMDAARKNPEAVKDYKAWKKEQDRLADKEKQQLMQVEEEKRGNEDASVS